MRITKESVKKIVQNVLLLENLSDEEAIDVLEQELEVD